MGCQPTSPSPCTYGINASRLLSSVSPERLHAAGCAQKPDSAGHRAQPESDLQSAARQRRSIQPHLRWSAAVLGFTARGALTGSQIGQWLNALTAFDMLQPLPCGCRYRCRSMVARHLRAAGTREPPRRTAGASSWWAACGACSPLVGKERYKVFLQAHTNAVLRSMRRRMRPAEAGMVRHAKAQLLAPQTLRSLPAVPSPVGLFVCLFALGLTPIILPASHDY